MNIARACNILTPTAEILEITTEVFPCLNEPTALEMVQIQQEIAALDGKKDAAARRDVIAKHTAALDKKYPGLRDVRKTLLQHARHVGTRIAAKLDEGSLTMSSPRKREPRKSVAEQVATSAANAARSSIVDLMSLVDTSAGANSDLSLVIDEKAIEYCATLCEESLAAVGDASRSVVACRARKDQKAQMLNLIRKFVPGCCTLAIGDGANDVAMIKVAHIGVGIIGKEGKESVNASDFAIGQFRFLRHLLFLHGRHNYRRFAIFLLFTFWKNIVTQMTMFFFSLSALGSGTLLFPSIFTDLLNPVMVTSLPILLYPMFDTDTDKTTSVTTPSLYAPGITRVHYTYKLFYRWCLEGVYASAICAYLPLYAMGPADFGSIALASLWTCAPSPPQTLRAPPPAPPRPTPPHFHPTPTPSQGRPPLRPQRAAAVPPLRPRTVPSLRPPPRPRRALAVPAACIVIDVRLVLEMHSWTKLDAFGFVAMVLVLVLITMAFTFVNNDDPSSFGWGVFFGTMGNTFDTASYWLMLFLT